MTLRLEKRSVGVRAARSWARAIFLGLMLGASLPLVGCDDVDRPLAIWMDDSRHGGAISGGRGEGELIYPRAIAYDAVNDWFYIVDRTARVQRFDSEGRFINGWQMPEWTNGKPVGLSVGPDGNLWVPDTHYFRVMIYSPSGELLRSFGRQGRGDGEFLLLTDIAFDAEGLVYVSEYGGNDRIQVFRQDGTFLRSFGTFGRGEREFARPQSIALIGHEIFVADACNHRISVWTTAGEHVRNLGRSGSGPGEFRFPYGLETDPDGHLIVTEFGGTRVQQIGRDGRALSSWGRGGKGPGELTYPWASVVDRRGRVVIVDSGNNRVQVVRF